MKLVGYRTLIVQVLTIIVAAYQSGPGVIDPKYTPLAVTVLACVNIVLRFLTTTPVGNPPPTPSDVIGAPNVVPTPDVGPSIPGGIS